MDKRLEKRFGKSLFDSLPGRLLARIYSRIFSSNFSRIATETLHSAVADISPALPQSSPPVQASLPVQPPPAHFSGWHFCPLCATKLEMKEVCERLRLACSSKGCEYVHWDSPKPVALCLIEMDDGIVLTRRRFPPKVGDWCIPGGFVEAHEAPHLAAKRESWEETGLLVEITTLLGVYSPCQGANEVVIVFCARPVGGALNKGDEVLELGVFKESQLPADIGFAQHLEIIQDGFRKKRKENDRTANQ